MTVTPKQRMELQRVAERLARVTAQRDELVVNAYRDGASLREIADLLGVHHVTVRNILKRNS